MIRFKMRTLTTISFLNVFLFVISYAITANAAPNISGVSGTIADGASVVIAGSDFRTKQNAAPAVWDDCSGTNPLDLWDGTWGTIAVNQNPAYAINYRTAQRGIPMPHSHISKYLCGSHAETSGNSRNVFVWKTRTVGSYPIYTYMSFYYRCDNNWVFGDGDVNNNHKVTDFSMYSRPYGNSVGVDYWYIEYSPHPQSTSSTIYWQANPWGGGHVPAANPWREWVKVEIEIKHSNNGDGWIKVWDNGILKRDYRGTTDSFTGTTRTDTIGGYAIPSGQPNNWRYFADIYLDYTISRVIIGNASTLTQSTIREVQVPSAWSDNSVNIRVNQGMFANGQRAYLYILNSNGEVNSNGYPLTFSQGSQTSDTTPPASPAGITITPLN